MRESEPAEKQDGDPLEGGLVVFRRGDIAQAVFRCRCGREQRARHEQFPGGGIPESTAHIVGWRRIGGSWNCPICTGNMANLAKAFGV